MEQLRKWIVVAALTPMILLSSVTTSFAQREGRKESSERLKKEHKEKRRQWRGKEAWHGHRATSLYPYTSLNVPPGHLPPPGECRVWLPGTPPGQQPSAQSCSTAAFNAPPGAWIISHEGDRYRVNMYNRERGDMIDEVRYYMLR